MVQFLRRFRHATSHTEISSPVEVNNMTSDSERLIRRIARLKEDPDLSAGNRQAILTFLDECAAEGLSTVRQLKHICMLRAIALRFSPRDFSFQDADESDLKQVVAAINRADLSEHTKVDLKGCIKKFYKTMNGGVPPEMIRFVRATLGKPTSVTRDDLFSPDDVRAVLSEMRNIRDKAFTQVLYESGARPGELLACSISDVQFKEDGDFISLQGLKGTPDRTNQLVESGLLLREWIRSHPCGGNPLRPKDPTAPLWVKLEQTSCASCGVASQFHKERGCDEYLPRDIEQMRYGNIRMSFKRACAKAGIKKTRPRMYSLRHSRITEMSQFLSNQQLCKFAGWKPGSGQFEVYVHLTNEDVNEAIRKRYNLGSSEADEMVSCPMCGHPNALESIECRRCKRPLSIEGAAKKQRLQSALDVLARLQEEGKLEKLLATFAPHR